MARYPKQASAKLTSSRDSEGNATDRAYAILKRRIQSNALKAGQTYLQEDIAESLGLSRTPSREAIIRLACENLIQIRPRYGILIRPVSIKEIGEICEVLAVLEARAAYRAAANGLSPDHLRHLEAADKAMQNAITTNNIGQWIRHDEDFHRLLVRAAGNDELGLQVELFWTA